MLIIENIKMAFGSLLANKLRSILTMLGIIIGVGAVIAIMTVSSSLKSSMLDSFQEMGANNIILNVKQKSSDSEEQSNGLKFGAMSKRSDTEEEDLISDDMIKDIKKEYKSSIKSVSLSESVGSGTIKSGSDYANITLTGINKNYFDTNSVDLVAGRYITSADVKGNKSVIMISDSVVDNMFDGDAQSALWQKISVDVNNVYYDFYVVGVYEYESGSNVDSSSDEDATTPAYLPITTGKAKMHSDDGYSSITIVTKTTVDDVDALAEEVGNYVNLQYYSGNDDYEVSASTMSSMVESMDEMIGQVSLAIAIIAGISLLVGGIGVMNIMLVSVTERTREIGTRKALGAKKKSIRLQFIIESITLCLVGGVLGILVGFLLGVIAASVMGYSASVPVGSIIVSVLFSMVIGVFFGYYPANKAAKMNPIEALRYE